MYTKTYTCQYNILFHIRFRSKLSNNILKKKKERKAAIYACQQCCMPNMSQNKKHRYNFCLVQKHCSKLYGYINILISTSLQEEKLQNIAYRVGQRPYYFCLEFACFIGELGEGVYSCKTLAKGVMYMTTLL